MKKYTIAYRREAARPDLIEAAEAVAADTLPTPAIAPTRDGVGFLGIHDGRGAGLVFVDWWEQENELHGGIANAIHVLRSSGLAERLEALGVTDAGGGLMLVDPATPPTTPGRDAAGATQDAFGPERARDADSRAPRRVCRRSRYPASWARVSR
jgi:hypothetical protein